MFEFLHAFFAPLHDSSLGAVGDTSNHCPAAVPQCSSVSQFHQGQIVIPKPDETPLDHTKVLNPVRFNSHSAPQFLSAMGPSVKSDSAGKIFAFTARVDPDTALVDGVRVDWSSPPDAMRVLVSPNDSPDSLHEATGWIPSKADGRFAGGVPQSQNVIFSRPEWVKQISVEMRDAPNETKTQFGIQQVALVTNSHDFSRVSLN